MSAWDSESFGGGGIRAVTSVPVDVYTSTYRVSGNVETRFSRITEILNQLSTGYLTVAQATVSEHGASSGTLGAPIATVAVDEILVMVASDLDGGSGDMRIPKRPVKAQLAIPPFRITGTIHVSMGSRPIDGLLYGTDHFIAMTDATIASRQFPDVERSAPVLALRRGRAHVLLVADDENPDELLAEVLDERTAEAWLRPDEDAG
jgi:hypothetical protein